MRCITHGRWGQAQCKSKCEEHTGSDKRFENITLFLERSLNLSSQKGQIRLRANGCNNSQQVWDLQCIVGRIQPIGLCNPCIMSVRDPYNVGRTVQTDPTLLRYASAITEQKKCWELSAEKFDWFQTLRNNIQQHATGCANGRNM